ncbi:hypothetical protein MNBD_BACTEROID03-1312 [hydrothermal vent metagenome]|uniref:Uncharacterized protein n=1 Tax=hydrothermal vent metagenome TaxID=652676 RepID=A0A3B0UDG6_9ZZZZ
MLVSDYFFSFYGVHYVMKNSGISKVFPLFKYKGVHSAM